MYKYNVVAINKDYRERISLGKCKTKREAEILVSKNRMKQEFVGYDIHESLIYN